ncbi:unnamed protein product [Ceratitis capitata]|uniref:(Mediterranean fruit fly) hypothetical protein n=1 Tax=Ceratitis capitata TaxID=7213 RepID=W8B4Z6_CERCA|nr:unnamed protein product [Ceratitis capitata]
MALTGCYKNDNPELNISDCSSEEEGITISRQNLPQTTTTEELNITWSSDDDVGTENCFLNQSLIQGSAVTPVSRSYSSSARKAKLPKLSIKRKLNRSVDTQSDRRTALSNINKPLNEETNNNRSPWCKIRKTFSILRCQSSSPNIGINIETKQKTPTKNLLSPQPNSEETSIEWSSSSSETSSPIRATNNGISTTQTSTAPTELELLVALIERENAASSVISRSTPLKQKKKRYLQGGYAECLQKLEEAKRIERHFLKHDQHLGLQQGMPLRVQKINQAFGVHIATVQLEHDANNMQSGNNVVNDNITTLKTNIRIVIDADMAAQLKEGSRIEAFFDADVEPYSLQEENDTDKDVIYVQPHKLLLL